MGQQSLMLDAASFGEFSTPVLLDGAAPEAAGVSGAQGSDASSGTEALSNPLGDSGNSESTTPVENSHADIAPDTSAFAFDGPDMGASALMEALLIIGDAAPSRTPGVADGEAMKEAVMDVLAETAIDALIGQFADSADADHAQAAEVIAEHLSEFLGMDISAAAISMMPGVNEVSVDDSADVALLHG